MNFFPRRHPFLFLFFPFLTLVVTTNPSFFCRLFAPFPIPLSFVSFLSLLLSCDFSFFFLLAFTWHEHSAGFKIIGKMEDHSCRRSGLLLEKGMPAKRPRQEDMGFCADVLPRMATVLMEDNGVDVGEGTIPHSLKIGGNRHDRTSLIASTMKSTSSSSASSLVLSSSLSSSSSSSSLSSRSMSPVSPERISLPLHIVSPMESGNNSQVFLARRVNDGEFALAEDREAAPRKKQQSRAYNPPQCGEADCDGTDAGITTTAEDACMALKFVSSSSSHMQREIYCLRYLNRFRGEPNAEANDEVNEAPNGGQCTASLLLPTRCFPPPCPKLFFTQEVGGYVAIGLELLGPDLFAFTERFVLYEEELCVVGIELLRALSAIHQQGVTHRSIKPENFCWNSREILNNAANKDRVGHDKKGSTNSVEDAPVFIFKIIDYGRGSVNTDDSPPTPSLYERPYRGWWHGLRGLLGKPMGQKDDLMGVVHTIGYLLDDYESNEGSLSVSSRSSSLKRMDDAQCDLITRNTTTNTTTTTTTTTNTNNNATNNTNTSFLAGESSMESCAANNYRSEKNGSLSQRNVRGNSRNSSSVSSLTSNGSALKSRRRSYSSWRRHFADRIAIAYRAASKSYRRLHGSEQMEGTQGRGKRASRAEHKLPDAVDRRNARRAWIVRHVETEYLPAMLPDRYYPPTMPQWWAEWFAACNAWCSDDAVTVEEMTAWMMERMQKQIEKMGETVERLRQDLKDLYVRYHEGREDS
ncbi:hypothetical protein MOQ_004219 [Trypanosoma cruzi marinkellei]|uniref:Protein kinase domain-containing protein n=1 Tax=Trypanosoma cruzi marinkellei TaxID=85056 RepID=K2NSI7_TRYCR|nr:hypothetical protein MOQ_004219 [Trypanosoma cruzi marinkellei]